MAVLGIFIELLLFVFCKTEVRFRLSMQVFRSLHQDCFSLAEEAMKWMLRLVACVDWTSLNSQRRSSSWPRFLKKNELASELATELMLE